MAWSSSLSSAGSSWLSLLAHRVVQQLARSEVIELVPITMAMAEQAAELAAVHRILGCDAVYVALADQLSDTLVTLDRQQLEPAASGAAVRCIRLLGALDLYYLLDDSEFKLVESKLSANERFCDFSKMVAVC